MLCALKAWIIHTQKQYTRLRKTAQKRSGQYIKSEFINFWAPYVLLRSDFDSKG